MCYKRKTRAILSLIFAGIGFAGPAEAGFFQGDPPHVTVRLEPDQPGPYPSGEPLTVDVWLQNEEQLDLSLRTVAVDFSLSDPNLALGPEFNFDTTIFPVPGVFNTFPEFPRPYAYMPLLCCPSYNIQLSANSQVHLGALDLTLPTEPGLYTLDALNAAEPDLFVGGAYVDAYVQGTGVPLGFWHAYEGEIGGEPLELQVIPEPTSVALVGLGGLIAVAFAGKRPRRRVARCVFVTGLTLLLASSLSAQPATIPSDIAQVAVDSGPVSWVGAGSGPVVAFSEVLAVDNAPWMQIHFQEVVLSGSAVEGTESFLRLTSLEDGATQTVSSASLAIGGSSSAAFNGDQLLLELLVYSGTGNSRVIVDTILFGTEYAEESQNESRGGGCVDDRQRSSDPRTGRFVYSNSSTGLLEACTAFLFNDQTRGFLTAGHCCTPADFNYPELHPRVEFNVPDSESNGDLKFPDTVDQYRVEQASMQHGEGVGTYDWCYFGVYDNLETGLSPLEAQRASYRLADEAPLIEDADVRITGYGLDSGVDNHTQQTAVGPYEGIVEQSGSILVATSAYVRQGNSGGAIEQTCRGLVYGIVTLGDPYFCHNRGTPIQHPDLQAALANPTGICADCNQNGIPDPCDVSCGSPGGECDVEGCGMSLDCNGNNIPDECEPDCNANGVVDDCDIEGPDPTSDDVNDNLIPDECETRIVVDGSAQRSITGFSWKNAFSDLQDALDYALASQHPDAGPCNLPVEEIWVAEGTYTPDPEDGRSSRFELSDGNVNPSEVRLFGGFPAGGGDGTFTARDPAAHPTILSGDLAGDDEEGLVSCEQDSQCNAHGGLCVNGFCILSANNTENSYHVLFGSFYSGRSFMLDGFTITGGNANGTSGGITEGGGLWGGEAIGTVANCTFRGNSAKKGGGVHGKNDIAIINSVFLGNSATFQGGGMLAEVGDSPSVVHEIINCSFARNRSGYGDGGGGIRFNGASTIATVSNSILWGNNPSGSGQAAQISWDGDNVAAYNSCIQDLDSIPGNYNISHDPLFVDQDGADLRLLGASQCIDTGDNTAVPLDTYDLDGDGDDAEKIPFDIEGNARIVDGDGDTAATVDMGAFEHVAPARPMPDDRFGLERKCSISLTACIDDDNCPAGETCLGYDVIRPCSTLADCLVGIHASSEVECILRDPGVPGSGICYVYTNRYLSVDANLANAGTSTARRISLDHGGGQASVLGWIGAPQSIDLAGPEPSPQWRSEVVANSFYTDWTQFDSVHLGDCEISPGHRYLIEAIREGSEENDETRYSEPLALETVEGFGDVTGSAAFEPPDTNRNFKDINAAVRGFSSTQKEPKVWIDLQGSLATPEFPDFSDINFADINLAVGGFQGAAYPFPAPCDCPGQTCNGGGGAGPDGGGMDGPSGGGAGPLGGGEGPLVSSEFVLVPSDEFVGQGQLVEVDVFVVSVPDLATFQVALDVTGGDTGDLQLEDLYIDTGDPEYVFTGLSDVNAVDLLNGRLGATLMSGSVSVVGQAYLGTFVYRASPDAVGVFAVTVRADDDTFLLDANAAPVSYSAGSGTLIGCEVECTAGEHCDDGNDCTVDQCNSGQCGHVPEPYGTPCDDGLFCTSVDVCNGLSSCEGSGMPCKPSEHCCEDSDSCEKNGVPCP